MIVGVNVRHKSQVKFLARSFAETDENILVENPNHRLDGDEGNSAFVQ
jgi:hypothetical protein